MPEEKNKIDPIIRLSKQVSRLADASEKQNSYKRRLFSGMLFGIGTAIGASIVATMLIVFLSQILSLAGVYIANPDDLEQILEKQLHSQTPQD